MAVSPARSRASTSDFRSRVLSTTDPGCCPRRLKACRDNSPVGSNSRSRPCCPPAWPDVQHNSGRCSRPDRKSRRMSWSTRDIAAQCPAGRWIAIHLAAVSPGLSDQLGLAPVFQCLLAQRRLQPSVEAARLEARAPAHRLNRELSAIPGYERVSHFASLAKCAVAFVGDTPPPGAFPDPPQLGMSRSAVTAASSRFRRRISASFTALRDDAFANVRFHAQ